MRVQLEGEFKNAVRLEGEFKQAEEIEGESGDLVTAYYLAEEGGANRLVTEGGADSLVLERM